jgi:DNA repair protein RecO (recombination protein O)
MLKKTTGIIVSYLKYKESSIIVKIFTRELGLRSFIVNGVRSNKSKMALYQPLTLVDLVVYDKANSTLNRIAEARLSYAFQKVPFEYMRTGIAMFVGELLSKCIYDNYENPELFDFISGSVWLLDQEDVGLTHFPLAFLLGISRFLGFAPEDPEGFFEELGLERPVGDTLVQEKKYLAALLQTSYNCNEKVGGLYRRNLLDYFLLYFSKHLDSAGEWKSIKILRQILS